MLFLCADVTRFQGEVSYLSLIIVAVDQEIKTLSILVQPLQDETKWQHRMVKSVYLVNYAHIKIF